ncbi:carbonic anhydrase [Pseudomassariella vexata]|uniref:Carbonic anhydrase n=1 Tax=Pseudomassariella vexata TaxID=1141098 RepID=A0A1Y2E9N5_9PEZI|nr:carbonic anhydrase [Pseudomassariella vexata]ORY68290.1 carbonic anhydrase [Pseudomassariella vexata]
MSIGNHRLPPSVEEMLRRSSEIAKTTHKPFPLFSELAAVDAPKPKIFIFSCIDPRADPASFFGIGPADALIVKNIGGHVNANFENLIFIDQFLGTLTDVLVIQHTDCGALHITNEAIRQNLKDNDLGRKEDIDELDFGTFTSVEDQVRRNVKFIKDSPFIRDELKARTQGLAYDIKTGVVTRVV